MVCLSAGKVVAQPSAVKFTELNGLQKKQSKLVLVLIGTDWCKYCKAMEQSLKSDKQIGGILKASFYPVFLNAEETSEIVFAGRRFKFKPTGTNTGVNELAEQLGTLNGQLTFPTLCFLNAENEIIYQHQGYLNSSSLMLLLNKLIQSR